MAWFKPELSAMTPYHQTGTLTVAAVAGEARCAIGALWRSHGRGGRGRIQQVGGGE